MPRVRLGETPHRSFDRARPLRCPRPAGARWFASGIGIKIAKTEIDQAECDSSLGQLPRVTSCEAKRIPQVRNDERSAEQTTAIDHSAINQRAPFTIILNWTP